MKPNCQSTTTSNSEIQDNPSVSQTEQPHQPIPTIPGLPNLDLVYPSLIPFLMVLINVTDKFLVPLIAERLKLQKTKLHPDKKESIAFNFFTFNQVVNILKDKDDSPKS